MAQEAFVDVAYRGLEVGRRLRLREVGPRTAYVEVGTPMPVGAGLVLRTDEGVSIAAIVIRVHEQVAGADMPPGMRIRTEELDGAAAGWWQALVTRGDPDIPEPEQGPVALTFEVVPQAHDTAVMKVAEVAEVAEVVAAPAAPPESGNGESDADPHTLSASHTVVMSAVEISEITGLPVEDDDSGEVDAAPDDAEAGERDGVNGAAGSNGDEMQGGRGRRRKRRRR